jgi:hypothetical protein
MRFICALALVFSLVVLVSLPAFAADRSGAAPGVQFTGKGPGIKNVTLEKAQALERRAATLDRLGRTEEASRLRTMIAGWEKEGPLPSRPLIESHPYGAAGAAICERSKPGSMICASPWGPDVLIYTGTYAYNMWLYGSSIAVDYDSTGNIFVAVGLADSTIHIFESTDMGATWTDEVTATPLPKRPISQLGLLASDDGDSTFLNLFYIWPGGPNLWSIKYDYSTWTQLNNPLISDSVSNFWATRDRYFDNDYYLYVAYERDSSLFFNWTDNHGSAWYTPDAVGDTMSQPCLEYGGYTTDGTLYLGAIWRPAIDTSDAWVTRSTDYGTTWGPWTSLFYTSGSDVRDLAIGATQQAPASQLAHLLASVDYLNTGDINLWVRCTSDGGATWEGADGISYAAGVNEQLASVSAYRSPDNNLLACAYVIDDTVTGAFDSIMYVTTDTMEWVAKPGIAINESLPATNIRPQITFGFDGMPGIAYAGSGGTNIYYDNVWSTGAQERGKADRSLTLSLLQNSPNPFRGTTSLVYVLPARGRVSLKVYNIAGQEVRTLLDCEQDAGIRTVAWDGLDSFGDNVSAGVYIYRLTTGTTALAKKLVLVR